MHSFSHTSHHCGHDSSPPIAVYTVTHICNIHLYVMLKIQWSTDKHPLKQSSLNRAAPALGTTMNSRNTWPMRTLGPEPKVPQPPKNHFKTHPKYVRMPPPLLSTAEPVYPSQYGLPHLIHLCTHCCLLPCGSVFHSLVLHSGK